MANLRDKLAFYLKALEFYKYKILSENAQSKTIKK